MKLQELSLNMREFADGHEINYEALKKVKSRNKLPLPGNPDRDKIIALLGLSEQEILKIEPIRRRSRKQRTQGTVQQRGNSPTKRMGIILAEAPFYQDVLEFSKTTGIVPTDQSLQILLAVKTILNGRWSPELIAAVIRLIN